MLQQTQIRSSNVESADRPIPSFAEAIKPLFREEDRMAMSWAFDLWDAESVRTNAAAILDHLERGNIPIDHDPWPDEQVQLFREWMREMKP
jgi:hypothetical protein